MGLFVDGELLKHPEAGISVTSGLTAAVGVAGVTDFNVKLASFGPYGVPGVAGANIKALAQGAAEGAEL